MSKEKIVRHLYDVNDAILKMSSLPIVENEAKLVRNLYGYLAIMNLSPISPFEELNYPEDFIILPENGALSLYEYGKNQFVTLKEYCINLCGYIEKNNINNIVILESPLGNVVPVSAFSEILKSKSIHHEIESINAPRNNKKSSGLTYNDIFNDFCEKIKERNANIFYFDDAITGTRFNKNYTTLRKKLDTISPDAKLYCTAFSFEPLHFPYQSLRADHNRIKNRLKTKLNDQYSSLHGFTSWIDFPPLPRFKVDDGLPMTYESPVAWGDVDFVAGKRKVNLVFNIIDTFKFILNDLTITKSESRIILNTLWSKDINKIFFVIPDKVLREAFTTINTYFNWEHIYTAAKQEFHSDYSGNCTEISSPAVYRRYQWILDEILKTPNDLLTSQQKNILKRALADLFFFIDKPRTGINKNHDYVHYTIPFNSTIKRFHGRLIELIIA